MMRGMNNADRRTLRNIRKHQAALGAPVDDLSDEELERRVTEFGRVVRNIGGTSAEAAAMLGLAGRHAKR